MNEFTYREWTLIERALSSERSRLLKSIDDQSKLVQSEMNCLGDELANLALKVLRLRGQATDEKYHDPS